MLNSVFRTKSIFRLLRPSLVFKTSKSFSAFKVTDDVLLRNADILQNYTPVPSYVDRMKLTYKYAYGIFSDTERADYLSGLGDVTSYHILDRIRNRMIDDEVGRQILEEKPRVNTQSIKWDSLKSLPPNSFGRQYFEFLDQYGFTPDGRPVVKHVPDFELAYIIQRYKEIHDFIHTIQFPNIQYPNELLIKWFEMIQLGLPSTVMGALAGSALVKKDEWKYFQENLPRLLENANRCPFVMNIYWEKHFEEDIDELRKKLRIRGL